MNNSGVRLQSNGDYWQGVWMNGRRRVVVSLGAKKNGSAYLTQDHSRARCAAR